MLAPPLTTACHASAPCDSRQLGRDQSLRDEATEVLKTLTRAHADVNGWFVGVISHMATADA